MQNSRSQIVIDKVYETFNKFFPITNVEKEYLNNNKNLISNEFKHLKQNYEKLLLEYKALKQILPKNAFEKDTTIKFTDSNNTFTTNKSDSSKHKKRNSKASEFHQDKKIKPLFCMLKTDKPKVLLNPENTKVHNSRSKSNKFKSDKSRSKSNVNF